MSEQQLLDLTQSILELFPESSIPKTAHVRKYRTPGYRIVNDSIKAKRARRNHKPSRASRKTFVDKRQMSLLSGKMGGEVE